MNIKISYDPYQSNWYVGELYKAFHQYLLEKKYTVSYTHIKDLAKYYNEPLEYCGALPSVFSIYSLIIECDNKTLIHNLSDYACLIPQHQSAIDKLNVKIFAVTSNLTENILNEYKNKSFIIQPSFYILENLNDLTLIEKYKNQQPKKKICYFNGLLYGIRQQYKDVFSQSKLFNILNKSNSLEFRNKNDYFTELSQYAYGLSLNGAAKVCYRDLEYFGLGILCLREELNIITHNPIIPDYHYKILIDHDIYSKIYNIIYFDDIIKKIENTINSITDEEKQFLIHNARSWYNQNATLQNQIKILEKFLHQLIAI